MGSAKGTECCTLLTAFEGQSASKHLSAALDLLSQHLRHLAATNKAISVFSEICKVILPLSCTGKGNFKFRTALGVWVKYLYLKA